MGEFVLVVEFEVKPEAAERFLALIAENARASVSSEPGCLQFDVTRAEDASNRILLYEVYKDRAAFEAHGQMPHFAAFFAAARPMILSQTARRFERVSANAKRS
jgi:autoinducer 2-degrading protein